MTADTLTLEALAARLEMLDIVTARIDALERRNDLLEQENQELRAALATRKPPVAKVEDEDASTASAMERLSRRWVLHRGMQAVAASITAGVLVQQTTADSRAGHSSDDILARNIVAHYLDVVDDQGYEAIRAVATSAARAAVEANNLGAGPGLRGQSAGANGAIEGKSNHPDGSGVFGTGRKGVIGSSSHAEGSGVFGSNPSNIGVLGEGAIGVRGKSSTANRGAVHGWHTSNGAGVVGDGAGNGQAGVLGRNSAGDGVRGDGHTGVLGVSTARDGVRGEGPVGVHGESSTYVGVHGNGKTGVWGTTASASYSGVYGENSATGNGVYGQAPSGAGVRGVSAGGYGVQGEGKTGLYGTSPNGNGVQGEGSGYGGQFKGNRAQLRLVPAATSGRPTTGSHQKGELYLDSAGTLYVCIGNGTPGTWRKISVTTA